MHQLINLQSEIVFRNLFLVMSGLCIVDVEVEMVNDEELVYFWIREEAPIILALVFVEYETVASICVGVFLKWDVLEPCFVFSV